MEDDESKQLYHSEFLRTNVLMLYERGRGGTAGQRVGSWEIFLDGQN